MFFKHALVVMPTHDTYLDNGTDIGLTVDEFILSHFDKIINNL